MATTDQTPEVRSAQGAGAFVLGAENPAIIINPAASKADLLFWARAELGSLYQWLELVTSGINGPEVTPSEFALMVTDKLEPVLQSFDAALKDGKG